MAKLNAGKWLLAGGTSLAAQSQYQQGRSIEAQLRYQAGQTRASSQRDAQTERKRALLLQSRALAVAAASGGGAGDPTVQKLIADIGAQGEANALNTLYEGTEAAKGMEFEGRMRKREGKARAMSTILSGAGALAEKYG